jgi:predicted DNA-binding transcriptional regulator AlpA
MSEMSGELLMALATADAGRQAAALRVLKGEAVIADQPMPAVIEPYLTLREAARRIGISAVSLWRWQVPGHDLGGRRRFRMSEIQAYLESDVFKAWAEELKAARKEVAGKSA